MAPEDVRPGRDSRRRSRRGGDFAVQALHIVAILVGIESLCWLLSGWDTTTPEGRCRGREDRGMESSLASAGRCQCRRRSRRRRCSSWGEGIHHGNDGPRGVSSDVDEPMGRLFDADDGNVDDETRMPMAMDSFMVMVMMMMMEY